jgi:hypothetical protein
MASLTITNLLEYASFVLNPIEDGNQVDSIYTDFSKAFDRLRHRLLLNEMSVGIEPARCMWLRSYLSGRIQKIRIGDAVSKDIKVTSGVPQGSHLGPLCFIRFVNRIHCQNCLKSQLDRNKLSEWCDRNSLLLNVDKCKTITFAKSRHPVKFIHAGWDRAQSSELHK